MYQAIKERRSVRSYQKKSLLDKDIKTIQDILNRIEKEKGPFSHQFHSFLVKNKEDGKKIGTYGFIKNPPMFFGGTIKNTQKAMVDYGYLFEKVILELTKKQFGTVWLGGTFNRSDFDIDIKKNDIIPAVSPVGYPAKPSIREHVIRKMANAKNRKPFEELFFENKSIDPVTDNHPYAKYLKAIQMAPSASNKQPWRVLIMDDIFHIYLERTKAYGEKLPIDIQSIDMGIAISHLFLSLDEDGLNPYFIHEKPTDINQWEYILSLGHSKSTS